ncbi:hypothetical protein E5C26_01670 [Serratia proteamaculans]|uniref:hypothetical protein n=1 Tax=Serratia proteamaculans TaxID=28151 RepID=UPI0010763916|nr:hypothetical protein [Serratia proteamaculans]TFZ53064.1 hypothetical protein E5C26_01670 [Serratia proteamaculans]
MSPAVRLNYINKARGKSPTKEIIEKNYKIKNQKIKKQKTRDNTPRNHGLIYSNYHSNPKKQFQTKLNIAIKQETKTIGRKTDLVDTIAKKVMPHYGKAPPLPLI